MWWLLVGKERRRIDGFNSFHGWSGDYAVNTRGLLLTVDRKRAERGSRCCEAVESDCTRIGLQRNGGRTDQLAFTSKSRGNDQALVGSRAHQMSSGGGFGGWGAAPGTAPHPSRRSAFDVSPSSPPSVGSRLEGMVSSLRLEGAGGGATAAHHRPPSASSGAHSRTPLHPSAFSAARSSRPASNTGRPSSAKAGSPDHIRRRQGA